MLKTPFRRQLLSVFAVCLALACGLLPPVQARAVEPVVIDLVDRLPDGRRIGFWTQVQAGGGGDSLVLVDTGSKGLMIMADRLGSNVTKTGRRMKQSFQDGTVMEGYIVNAVVRLGPAVSSKPLAILAVDKVSCARERQGCPAYTFWRKPLAGIMGVGLGEVSTLDNPLAFFGPELSSGFIIRGGNKRETASLTLGISKENSGDFVRFPMPKRSLTINWQDAFFESNALDACIAINTDNGVKQCGKFLLDSGSSLSVVRMPGRKNQPGQKPDQDGPVAPGKPIKLSIKGLPDLDLSASPSPWTDRIILARDEKARSILGAGIFLHMDVLYDLKNHAIGLRPLR